MKARDGIARHLLILLLLAIALRAPFINQAFQLDDNYYLAGARHVQTDPAHPSRTSFVFLGETVDMRGHPHPPFNVWFLGLILKLTTTISEIPFHTAYFVFTVMALWGTYLLARRFTEHPLTATLLFMAVPAFVVHGNGVESDIPFLAFWVCAAAAFVRAVDSEDGRCLAFAGLLLAGASLAAYQAVLFVPILALYVWLNRRQWRAGYAVALVPVLVIGGYQLYEKLTTGDLPAAVLAGHFRTYNLQNLDLKVRNALALTGHLSWMLLPALTAVVFLKRSRPLWAVSTVAAGFGLFFDRNPLFWISFGLGAGIVAWCVRGLFGPNAFRWRRNERADEHQQASARPSSSARLGFRASVANWSDRDRETLFLASWIVVFFTGAVILFFAGSARYLLPIAAPLAILATREGAGRYRLIAAAIGLQFAFSILLAVVHYEHSGAYRDFVRSLEPKFRGARVWVNGEWGLQYYGQEAGARPLMRNQAVHPGEWVISNRLGYPVPSITPGAKLTVVAEREIIPSLPLRLIALESRSAFSTVSFGVRPFDLSTRPADILRAEVAVAREVKLSYLPMDAPEAQEQIVSGVYGLESNRWRWMGKSASLILNPPLQPAPLVVAFHIPETAPGRQVTVRMNGRRIAQETYAVPGTHELRSSRVPVDDRTAVVTIEIDQSFRISGDHRELGMVLMAVGFREEQ